MRIRRKQFNVQKESLILVQSATNSTNLTLADHVKFDTIISQIGGNKITPDITSPYLKPTGASIGRIILKKGAHYLLKGKLNYVTMSSGSYIEYAIYDSNTSTQKGSFAGLKTSNAAVGYVLDSEAAAYIDLRSATSDLQVELRYSNVNGTITSIGNGLSRPRIEIYEL